MNKKVISIIAIIALVAVLGVCLIACNADSYAKKLEKKGYEVQTMTEEEIEEFKANVPVEMEIKWGVGGVKGSDLVTILCFADKEQAESYATLINTMSGFMQGVKAETKGATLFIGTEQGIKDAK